MPPSTAGKNFINIGLFAANLVCGGYFLTQGVEDPTVAIGSLTAVALLSGVLGAHLTASIGGADMPVVITLLNSYSGGGGEGAGLDWGGGTDMPVVISLLNSCPVRF